MKQFFLTMAGVFAGLALFFVGVPLIIVSLAMTAARPEPVPATGVLNLDLRGALTDQEPQTLFGMFGQHPLSVMRVVQTLHRAQSDERIKALFIRLPEGGIDPGEADELRLAVRAFHDAGKPVFAHSQGLYPSGAITSTYMLGAAADELWMQPGAPFQATGLASEDIFYKRLFDKYGVKADFEQRYEYKNAVNSYLYDDYTDAHKEATLSWMGSIYDSALASAAADRKMNPAVLKTTIEAGPYDAADARAKGLVDKLGQVKDTQAAAVARAGDGAKLVDFSDYASDLKRSPASVGAPVIGVVAAEGNIVNGPGGGGIGGAQAINADDVADTLYAAANDKSIKAVVFRLSSPGGADTASEEIAAALAAVRAVKPVVVSMGTYGASGGYWVSSDASAIVAEPSTLTGSIGVYGGKFVLGPAVSKFGVDMRDLSVGGQYAGADSVAQEFTPAQRAAFAASTDRVYNGFIQQVASGRRMAPERVQQIARGRVWTGAQAKGLGLVDDLGGFYQAVDKAKALAGLGNQEVELKTVSARRSPFEALQHAFGVADTSLHTLSTAIQLLDDPRAKGMIEALTGARLRDQGENLLAPLPRF